MFKYRFIVLLFIMAACSSTSTAMPTETPKPKPTSFGCVDDPVSGKALVDVNDNGEADSTDAPLEDARFIIIQGSGDVYATLYTDAHGYAIGRIGTCSEKHYNRIYPQKLRMEPKEGNQLVATKEWSPSNLTFLFAPTTTLTSTTSVLTKLTTSFRCIKRGRSHSSEIARLCSLVIVHWP